MPQSSILEPVTAGDRKSDSGLMGPVVRAHKRPGSGSLQPHDGLSFWWLILALVLLPFGTARWNIPLAAWLYPVFLLRFARTQPRRRAIALVILAPMAMLAVAWQGFFGPYFPVPLAVLIVALLAILYALPYLADRVLVQRIGGPLGTLVFPLATTTSWYLFSLVSPWGTSLNPAYTQYGDLPLLQLLSVTGLWGVDFLMAWFASVVNWAWEREFAWTRVRRLALAYAALLAVVFLLGGARLAFFAPDSSTVRIAGISPSAALLDTVHDRMSQLDPQKFNAEMASGTNTPEDRAVFRQAWAPIVDELLARSEQEARAGAKVIVWPECAVQGFQEDEATLLGRVGMLAQSTGSYVDVGLCEVLQPRIGAYLVRDEATLIDPTGSVVSRFEKAHPVPGVETTTLPGDGQVQTILTPYGRLASIVCYDGDFPAMLAPAGRSGLDMLLIPGNDWREYDPYHTQLTTFRAIEQGYSLARQSSHGLAMAVDYEGNVLASTDYFTSSSQVMVAQVPTRGVPTMYAMIGDLFAWLAAATMVALTAVAIAGKRAPHTRDS